MAQFEERYTLYKQRIKCLAERLTGNQGVASWRHVGKNMLLSG